MKLKHWIRTRYKSRVCDHVFWALWHLNYYCPKCHRVAINHRFHTGSASYNIKKLTWHFITDNPTVLIKKLP